MHFEWDETTNMLVNHWNNLPNKTLCFSIIGRAPSNQKLSRSRQVLHNKLLWSQFRWQFSTFYLEFADTRQQNRRKTTRFFEADKTLLFIMYLEWHIKSTHNHLFSLRSTILQCNNNFNDFSLQIMMKFHVKTSHLIYSKFALFAIYI